MKTKRHRRLARFIRDVWLHTPFVRLLLLMVVLWLGFSAALYQVEHTVEGATIKNYGEALYWGVAAFSTAGIADTPQSDMARLIGGIWIVLGSALFFGAIVATITTYFMRPMQRPGKRIIDTIEYNLEQLDDLSLEELDLLKETVDMLIIHVENLKQARHQES
jgi:voltage-gated potassium channel